MIKNFFQIVDDVVTKRDGRLHEDQDFRRHFSSFMLVRYLSMRSSLMPFAEILNNFQGVLTPEQFYRLAYNMVPKQSNGFIKYIGKKKKTKKAPESEDTDA